MYKIAVDDGHGLETPGKRTPDGFKENIFNDAVKHFFIEYAKKQGFKIINTSIEKSDTPLMTRVKRANDANADIFLSFHYNAIGDNWDDRAKGIEVFCYKFGGKGEKLAKCIYNELLKGTKLEGRGVKEGNFCVIRETTMPAALIEYGFMSNHKEAALMKSVSYQRECAIETLKGVCKYFNIEYKKEDKTYIDILREVTKNADIYIDHIDKHPEINLKGLISLIYYFK